MANADQHSAEFLEGQIGDLIATSGPAVQRKVVNDLAEEVIEHRACLLTEALKRLRSMNKKLDSLKPDQISYDEAKQKQERFSECRMKEVKKFEEGIAKLDPAVTAVLTVGEKEGEDNKEAWDALEESLECLRKDFSCCNTC